MFVQVLQIPQFECPFLLPRLLSMLNPYPWHTTTCTHTLHRSFCAHQSYSAIFRWIEKGMKQILWDTWGWWTKGMTHPRLWDLPCCSIQRFSGPISNIPLRIKNPLKVRWGWPTIGDQKAIFTVESSLHTLLNYQPHRASETALWNEFSALWLHVFLWELSFFLRSCYPDKQRSLMFSVSEVQ